MIGYLFITALITTAIIMATGMLYMWPLAFPILYVVAYIGEMI